jgi:hypothetical protein
MAKVSKERAAQGRRGPSGTPLDPKEQRLLDLPSQGTFGQPRGGSTSPRPQSKTPSSFRGFPSQDDERLIAQVMQDGNMTREEAVRELTLIGAI